VATLLLLRRPGAVAAPPSWPGIRPALRAAAPRAVFY